MGINIIYWWHDHTPERLAMAKSALDRALALDPDHPEVHEAYGYYCYWGLRDYELALEHFNLALQNQPNNSGLIFYLGYVQWPLGKWETAAANLRKAAELDPRSYLTSLLAATTYLYMRNWVEAERFADRCVSIAPETAGGYRQKALVYLRSKGDVEKARGIMQEALEKVEPNRLAGFRSYTQILGRDYQKALAIVEADTAGWFLRKAYIYSLMGQREKAMAFYDSAKIAYEDIVRKYPNYYAYGDLGIAYAGLGRKEEALRAGQKGVELLPISQEAWRGYTREWDLAVIYTMVGEYEAAIDKIAYLLSIPGDLSVPLLKLDPTWDPLREHPRFQALVSGGLPEPAEGLGIWDLGLGAWSF